jgi:S-layer homology domain
MRRSSLCPLTLAVVTAFLGLGASMRAQRLVAVGSDRHSVEVFGLGNFNNLQIPAAAFMPADGNTWSVNSSDIYFYPSNANDPLVAYAPVQLPTGALITHLGLYFKDSYCACAQENHITVSLLELTGWQAEASKHSLATFTTENAGEQGYEYATLAYTVNNTVTNGGAQLVVEIAFPFPNGGLMFKAVDIGWTLQMSPAPASATFGDVPPTHPFFSTIEAFARAGITSGCGNGNFCPNQVVTRQEIAKFFVRALGLSWSDWRY